MTINISIKFLTLPVLPSQQQKPHRNGIWNKSSKMCLLSRSCSSSHRAIPLKPPSLSIKIFIINVTREREKSWKYKILFFQLIYFSISKLPLKSEIFDESHLSSGGFSGCWKKCLKAKIGESFFFMKLWYVSKVLLSKDNANKTTWRKFSMSEALPVISLLHFGHSGWFRPNLVTFLNFKSEW